MRQRHDQATAVSAEPWYLLRCWGSEPDMRHDRMIRLNATPDRRGRTDLDLPRMGEAEAIFQYTHLNEATQSYVFKKPFKQDDFDALFLGNSVNAVPGAAEVHKSNARHIVMKMMRAWVALYDQGVFRDTVMSWGMLWGMAGMPAVSFSIQSAQQIIYDVRCLKELKGGGVRCVYTVQASTTLLCDGEEVPVVYFYRHHVDAYLKEDGGLQIRTLPLLNVVAVQGAVNAKRLLLKAPFEQVHALNAELQDVVQFSKDLLVGIYGPEDIVTNPIPIEKPAILPETCGYQPATFRTEYSSASIEGFDTPECSIVGMHDGQPRCSTWQLMGDDHFANAGMLVFTRKKRLHDGIEREAAAMPVEDRQHYLMQAKLYCHSFEHAWVLRALYRHGLGLENSGKNHVRLKEQFDQLKQSIVPSISDVEAATAMCWDHYLYLADHCNFGDVNVVASYLSAGQQGQRPLRDLFPMALPGSLEEWEYWQLFLMELQPERIQTVLKSAWAKDEVAKITKDQWVKIGLSLSAAQRKNLSMVGLPVIKQAAQSNPFDVNVSDAAGITAQIKENQEHDWCHFPLDEPEWVAVDRDDVSSHREAVKPGSCDAGKNIEPDSNEVLLVRDDVVKPIGRWARCLGVVISDGWLSLRFGHKLARLAFWAVVMAVVGLVAFYGLPFAVPTIVGLSAVATKAAFAGAIALAVPALWLWVDTWFKSLPSKDAAALDQGNRFRVKQKWLYWGELMLYALMSAPLVVVSFAAWAPGAVGFAAMWGVVAKVGGVWAQMGVASLMVAGANMLVGTLNAWWVCGVADRHAASHWGIFWRILGKLLSVFALAGGILWLGGVASAITTTLVSSWTSLFAADGVMAGMVGGVSLLGAVGLTRLHRKAYRSGEKQFEWQDYTRKGDLVDSPEKPVRLSGFSRFPPRKSSLYDPSKSAHSNRSTSPKTVGSGSTPSNRPSKK